MICKLKLLQMVMTGVIQNVTNNGNIQLKVTSGAGALTHVATVTPTGIVPAADNTFTLGSC